MSFRADDKNTGSLQNPDDVPQYPLTSDIDAWAALGANLYRFPVLWNWLQPGAQFDSALDQDLMNRLDILVGHATQFSPNTTLENATYVIIDVASPMDD